MFLWDAGTLVALALVPHFEPSATAWLIYRFLCQMFVSDSVGSLGIS